MLTMSEKEILERLINQYTDLQRIQKSDDPEKVVEVLKENGFDVWEADEAYHANC